ncbi:ArnT family glycosyltransferase [Bordetella genomosp. 13]|uniref:Dolichyl-phosphate-mannose--protein mannosyltransferase n=1 Tax=Bordetella genomosp. 13 TaxID=463040 RepID=A0A1W6ZCV9_9BORD|nr:glycosyltransferase family 39 protein [Bordetella genomosp. 13]ARP95228.1 dolichyl-phosphate-mannose--protein mannosyltransferase [Bordetella genomosp. 13]
MRISGKTFWLLLGAAAAARLFAMAVMPLADTSEPRYAEVARLMEQTNDWITPWFEPGVPFWGKPPLAFWLQALSMRIFGIGEFAVRLPGFIAMAGLLSMLYVRARHMYGVPAARWSCLILATMLLPLVNAGAVLTDPFLAFAVTLSMLSFVAAQQGGPWYRGLGFFVGLALGMLAKGPLAVVLILGVCMGWMLWQRSWRAPMRSLPWARGMTLALVLTVPWYVAAEIKTPGFLHYFIIGEHVLRFIDSGWEGDRYGTAHARPLGAIWIDWIGAAAPWSLVILVGGVAAAVKPASMRAIRTRLSDARLRLLLLWALAPQVLFTLSGNILWTYVLPGLPAVALLLGIWLAGWQPSRWYYGTAWLLRAAAMLVPAAALALGVRAWGDPQHLKTEKGLVDAAQAVMRSGDVLYYVETRPFSARFYSSGQAQWLPWDTNDLRQQCQSGRVLAAVPRDRSWPALDGQGTSKRVLYLSRRFALYEISGCGPAR